MVPSLARALLRLGGVALKFVLSCFSNAQVNPDPSDHHRYIISSCSHSWIMWSAVLSIMVHLVSPLLCRCSE
ncbi:hypothetical protein QL093DRAFT_2525348 [Fusarium oxysporum]|nr:hypothetical protein QL093DRAFT_2525348 [Fusarium oxysporum]